MNQDSPIAIRDGQPNDYKYILSTWNTEFHKTIPQTFISNKIFYDEHSPIIDHLLTTSNITVMCMDDDPDFIIGYLIWKPYHNSIIIHWGNVKGNFRREGYMKTILQSIGYTDQVLVCSHYFSIFGSLRNKYNLIYDPTLLNGIEK